MSRAGYTDDMDSNWAMIIWRGQVASALRGKRGQAFLKELLADLDALPVKRLIGNDLRAAGEVCALGCVGAARGIELEKLDPEDYDKLAETFGIAQQLVREVEWINDEAGSYTETPEVRWERVREWVARHIKP